MNRPGGIIPLLHGGDTRGGQGPQDDQTGAHVQVGTGKEFTSTSVRVERSLEYRREREREKSDGEYVMVRDANKAGESTLRY